MLIALLTVLGVDLIVTVVVAVGVLSRRRWISRQSGSIRVADGELCRLGSNWRRGYGRWVRDVLVWTRARCCSAASLSPSMAAARSAREAAGAVKRLGDHPVVVAFSSGATRVEIAASSEQSRRRLAAGRPGTTQPEERPRVSTDHR